MAFLNTEVVSCIKKGVGAPDNSLPKGTEMPLSALIDNNVNTVSITTHIYILSFKTSQTR